MKKTIVLGMLLGTLAAMVPAHSSSVVAFRFNGTMSLPAFPCEPGGCVGTFTGTATGQLENTGANGSGPITNLAGTGPLQFTYWESGVTGQFPSGCPLGWESSDWGALNGLEFRFEMYRRGNLSRMIATYRYSHHGVLQGWAILTVSPALPQGCLLPGGLYGPPVTFSVKGFVAGI